MPSNSSDQKCELVKQQAKKGKFLGAGAFGEVREHGAFVIKTEKCKSGFRKRASDFMPNIALYKKALSRVISARLAPRITNAYACGSTCITIMGKAPGITLKKALSQPDAEGAITETYRSINRMHKLLNVSYGHGDLHASNVLVHKAGNRWKAVFIDFALERKLSRSYDWKFIRESIVGTAPRFKELVKNLENKYV